MNMTHFHLIPFDKSPVQCVIVFIISGFIQLYMCAVYTCAVHNTTHRVICVQLLVAITAALAVAAHKHNHIGTNEQMNDRTA